VITAGIAFGLGPVVWPARVVEGASEVVDGDAPWLSLEHADTTMAAAAARARSLSLMASQELSHTEDGVRNGVCHKLAGLCVKCMGDPNL
jgi:hypothetical protein